MGLGFADLVLLTAPKEYFMGALIWHVKINEVIHVSAQFIKDHIGIDSQLFLELFLLCLQESLQTFESFL